MLPRRFALVRHVDYTGVSGVGVVAYGVTFADGHVVLRWCSTHPATSMWSSVDDLLAIHGHGEATSIEWIDAPHGELEELSVTLSRGRRARRRAGPEPAPDEAGTGAVAATDTTSPADIPPAVTTAANQAAAEAAVVQAMASPPVEAEPARNTANAGDDTHPEPGPAGEPADELEPAPEAQARGAGREPTVEAERPRPQSTPGAGPNQTDELAATQAWPAWADVTGSGSVARPSTTSATRASPPERPAARDVRQENPTTGSGHHRWAEPRQVQRMEPPSRDDPESTDPFVSVLAEEPPEFPGRNNGHRHVDTITGLLDLPTDLVGDSRSADPGSAAGTGSGFRDGGSGSEPAPRQLRRAGRHRRDDD